MILLNLERIIKNLKETQKRWWYGWLNVYSCISKRSFVYLRESQCVCAAV